MHSVGVCLWLRGCVGVCVSLQDVCICQLSVSRAFREACVESRAAFVPWHHGPELITNHSQQQAVITQNHTCITQPVATSSLLRTPPKSYPNGGSWCISPDTPDKLRENVVWYQLASNYLWAQEIATARTVCSLINYGFIPHSSWINGVASLCCSSIRRVFITFFSTFNVPQTCSRLSHCMHGGDSKRSYSLVALRDVFTANPHLADSGAPRTEKGKSYKPACVTDGNTVVLHAD